MFNGCVGLKNIILPSSLTSLGEYSLSGTAIANITLPEKITNIPNGLFSNCSKLTNFTISSNINTLGRNAFENCIRITKFVIPDNVTTLGAYCFKNCTGLEELSIPISLDCTRADTNNSSSSRFLGVTNLKKINFTNGTGQAFNYINNGGLGGCQTTPWYYSKNVEGGISVTFEEGITSIGDNMFNGCTGLNKIIYKNNEYTNSSSFSTAFTSDGGTISSSAFSGAGF